MPAHMICYSLDDFLQLPATKLLDDVIPGFHLYRFTIAYQEIDPGDYVLCTGNQIVAAWSHELVADPYVGMSDEAIDADDTTDPGNELLTASFYSAGKLSDALVFDPQTGYAFMQACTSAGYDLDEDGTNVAAWFNDRVALALKTRT